MKNYMTRTHNPFDLLDDPFTNFFRPFYVEESAGIMNTDISETENSYILEIEMAGFDKKNIGLKFENGYLTVSAKNDGVQKDKYIRKERSCSCSRSYYLGDVNQKAIKAKYENGILTVDVPKEKPENLSHNILID